jgi:hypothetical protein
MRRKRASSPLVALTGGCEMDEIESIEDVQRLAVRDSQTGSAMAASTSERRMTS